MGPTRKGAGGKKKGGNKKSSGARKRKQWDDYDPREKKRGRSAITSDDETDGPSKKQKKTPSRGSMFTQWKDKKISQRQKERKFVSTVGQKKAAQREQYLEQKRRAADVAYGRSDSAKTKPDSREVAAADDDEDDDDGSDSDSEEEEEAAPRKRRSVFDQFVQAFQPATREFDDEEEDESEGEYEEIEVDEDGNPIEQDDDDQTDHDGDDAVVSDAAEDEEEEMEDGESDAEEHAAVEQQEDTTANDPYRQRYLLSGFTEDDAAKLDATPRKFVPLTVKNVDKSVIADAVLEEFSVSFRRGVQSDSDDGNVLSWMPTTPNVRGRLLDAWKARDISVDGGNDSWPAASPLESTLFKQMSSYADVFFAGQTYELTQPLRRLTAMHVLNHVLKSRDTIVRNNERLKRRESKTTDGNDETGAVLPEEDEEEKEYRDQGFCRATVLVLMPLRSAASQFVTELLELLPTTVTDHHNKDRFFDEYGKAGGDDEDEDDDEEEEETDEKLQKPRASGGDDGLREWQRVFSEGNNDDSFQIGISLSRRGIKFYSDYRQADIILASPLGLRQQLGDEVVDVAETQTITADFLSSIEVCVLDSASLLLMQNIEHLRNILQALNVKPKEAPSADFSRMREWNLSFLGAYFRQTILFAHGVEPLLSNLLNKCCRNQHGVFKYVRNYDSNVGESSASITRVVPQIKQIFQRIDLSSGRSLSLSPAEEVELRFEYFQKHIFTPLLDNPRRHVLIFVPSYFDYVRLRNLFHDTMNEKLIRAVQCCEYTTPKQVSRARTTFFHGRCHVMLFTERFHFYHQYQIRGIHQIIWYGLPAIGEFYPEMLNCFEDPKASGPDDAVNEETKSSIALFTRLDLLRLQRIVGQKRAERMCQGTSKKATFLFC